MFHKPEIILASASPRRKLLLREMGLRFTVVEPSSVEEVRGGFMPDVLAIHNAQRKARAVAGRHRESIVIGADTIVVLDGVLFGKPRDMAEAEGMLGQLAGRRHDVFTGVCLTGRGLDAEITFAERTGVWVRALSREELRTYLTKVNPLDKAGAYAAQEFGEMIIERIDGSFSNVMGLPVERLRAPLEKLGVLGATE